MTWTNRARTWTALLTGLSCVSGLFFAACGEEAQRTPFGDRSESAAPSTATLVIARGGLGTRLVEIAENGRLTVLNDDSVPRQLASDDHPRHTRCVELNLPVIAPGGALVVAVGQGGRTCTFHDEAHPEDERARGAIEIFAPRVIPD